MTDSFSFLLKNTFNDYIKKFSGLEDQPTELMVGDLMKIMNERIDEYNLGPRDESTSKDDPIKVQYPYQKQGSKRFKNIIDIHPYHVVRLAMFKNHFVKILWSGSDSENSTLAIYCTKGDKKGIYSISSDDILDVILEINPVVSSKDLSWILGYIKHNAPVKKIEDDVDLVAVNNGIFNYKTKTLMDFDPKYVFLSKTKIDYNPNAKNVYITMHDGEVWDVNSWIKGLCTDPDNNNLLWQIISASLRHKVRWDKAIFLYSPKGNNGKGTFCRLIRNLFPDEAHVSISVKEFSKNFMLSDLMRVSNVICDENDTMGYLEDAEAFKSAITQDVININIKYKNPVNIIFKGLIIQCINSLFKARDKSDSMYRRLLVVDMDVSFKGVERKYIKDDYLSRTDVLEYVLLKALTDESIFDNNGFEDTLEDKKCYSFHTSKSSQFLLSEFIESNDPIKQFWKEFEDDFSWEFLPAQFLYDLYKSWFERNVSRKGMYVSKKTFMSDCKTLYESGYISWYYDDNKKSLGKYCSSCEPLIGVYNLSDWFNDSYKGPDKDLLYTPNYKMSQRTRGFVKEGLEG